ncbi:metal-dependent hydrolase [Methanosarcina horonobensis]|uniref:metal-dependent hydrolase n=1 Tax=Methanosarcina horonobensis TaxID=418008 RepID=UPI000B105A0F|nr:metal-dependent hydrolase [Methanosarcina horonobensis]
MPYPVAHVLFFVFCVSAVAVYATFSSIFRRELSSRDLTGLLLLLFVGSAGTLLPDIMIVYNLPFKGSFEHCWAGPIATHSFLFSSTAILFGTLVGYVAYRQFGKAIYMGLFAEAAFLTHLLLDDIGEGGTEYLYPIYNGKVSVFSLMDVGFQEIGLLRYIIASFISVFFVCSIIMMALVAWITLVLSSNIDQKNNLFLQLSPHYFSFHFFLKIYQSIS